MTDRNQQLPAAVPRLIDQYKQRRQAWLAQADELVRLRNEVRSAAEREALEIVTAARKDVRRIVVEARRELLVLTAQLHAAIESVDQSSLHAAETTASGAETFGQAATDVLTGQPSLGATHDLVLGARREVRSVLDEARAEIEALVAETHGPLQEIPAALASSSVAEPPIPTLESLLGADPLAARGAGPASTAKAGLDSLGDFRQTGPGPVAPAAASALAGYGVATLAPTTLATQPFAPETVSMQRTAPALLAQKAEGAVSFIVAPPESPLHFGGFHETEAATEPSSSFGETGSGHAADAGRTFLVDYEEGPRSRPAWMWVGLFAATGIVAIVSTIWWFTTRDSSAALAVAARAESSPAAAVPPAAAPDEPAAETAVEPTGLAIEVRRTAWIRTVVDGKEDSREYQAGEVRRIVGARAVQIRAGDAGAVFVSIDGAEAQALGEAGRAVTKNYSLVGGVLPPVSTVANAAASPTPAVVPVLASPDASPARPETPVVPAPGAPRALETARANPPSAPATPTPAAPAPSLAAPAAAADSGAAPPAAGGGRADLIAAGQQWLDAYQRRDRDAMATSGTENMTISDERSVTERFPAWQAGVRRDLDQLELELSGDTALLTARMTERSGDAANLSAQHVSRVSQIWVRRAGRWRLADVRIIGEARLNQIVR